MSRWVTICVGVPTVRAWEVREVDKTRPHRCERTFATKEAALRHVERIRREEEPPAARVVTLDDEIPPQGW